MGNYCFVFVFVLSHYETHLRDGVGDNYCFKASVVDPEVKIYMKSEQIISICKFITFQPLQGWPRKDSMCEDCVDFRCSSLSNMDNMASMDSRYVKYG